MKKTFLISLLGVMVAAVPSAQAAVVDLCYRRAGNLSPDRPVWHGFRIKRADHAPEDGSQTLNVPFFRECSSSPGRIGRLSLAFLNDGRHQGGRCSVERFELNPNVKSARPSGWRSNLGLITLLRMTLPFWSLACSLCIRNKMLAKHTQL